MPTYANTDKFTFGGQSHTAMYKHEPTDLEEMKAHLTEHPEIAYVSFPHTWFGYGTTFMCLSNCEYLEQNYAGLLESFDTQMFVHRDAFMKAEKDSELSDLVELYFYTLNEYPVIDDALFSRYEHDALEEFIRDEVRYELELDDDQLDTVLQSAEIDFSEWAHIDNDGHTVYSDSVEMNQLMELLKGHI